MKIMGRFPDRIVRDIHVRVITAADQKALRLLFDAYKCASVDFGPAAAEIIPAVLLILARCRVTVKRLHHFRNFGGFNLF